MDWPALRRRFEEIGLTTAAARINAESDTELPDSARRSAEGWRARKLGSAAGLAARLFFCGESLSRDESVQAVGEGIFLGLAEAGWLVEKTGQWSSPYELHLAGGLLVWGDAASGVMALGETTALLDQASRPTGRVGKALDLGCGAGTLALLLSSNADAVTGTDIDPRAIRLAKINAEMNGVCGVDWREGDLFSPVDGERFDLIVAQLPFLPRAGAGPLSLATHGGKRGDELCLRALGDLRHHLTAGGRAFFLIDWALGAGESVAERVRGALGESGWRVLLLLSPELDALAHGLKTATEGARILDHLESMGVRACQQSVVAAECCEGDGWLMEWPLPGDRWRSITRRRIDELFASREARDDSDVEWAAGATLEERTVLNHPALRERRIVFDPEALLAPLPWTKGLELTQEQRREGLRRGWLRPR